MKTSLHLAESFAERLHHHTNPETKAWWENYVKGSAPFLGVKMPKIRSLLHEWHKEDVDGKLDSREQVNLALAFFDGEHTEEKLAGTLFLQEILLPANAIDLEIDLPSFAALFDDGKLYDWNATDWFCVKVLGPLIAAHGMPWAKRIAAWRNAENLWRARASLVAFVKVAGERAYYDMIEESCDVLIQRPERFAKTSVGWILRDISKHDEAFVQGVIERNLEDFSTEALKNATKYFEKS